MSYLEVIGRNIIDKDSLNREVGELGSTITRYVSFLDKLKLDDVYLKLEARDIGSSFILGHDTHGILGTTGYPLGTTGLGSWTVVATVSNLE